MRPVSGVSTVKTCAEAKSSASSTVIPFVLASAGRSDATSRPGASTPDRRSRPASITPSTSDRRVGPTKRIVPPAPTRTAARCDAARNSSGSVIASRSAAVLRRCMSVYWRLRVTRMGLRSDSSKVSPRSARSSSDVRRPSAGSSTATRPDDAIWSARSSAFNASRKSALSL
jgi:hypothetical protein